jgi:hypothetical protein
MWWVLLLTVPEVVMMALRRHTHRRPPTDLCLRGDAQRWEQKPSSGCDGIDAGQGKAKVDVGAVSDFGDD